MHHISVVRVINGYNKGDDHMSILTMKKNELNFTGLTKEKKEILKKYCGSIKAKIDLNKILEESKNGSY